MCFSSGACVPAAFSTGLVGGEVGAATITTTAVAATSAALALQILTLTTDNGPVDVPVYAIIENDSAPHPGQVKRNTESNEPIFIEPEFLDDEGFYAADPEEAPQYCPDGSKREGAVIPPLRAGQWVHIVNRHLHEFADAADNFNAPDQFLSPYEVEDYPLDFSISDEEMAKQFVMFLIYTAFCWGDGESNQGSEPGTLYTVELSTPVGIGADKSPGAAESDVVDIQEIQILVTTSYEVYTAFPLNPTDQ